MAILRCIANFGTAQIGDVLRELARAAFAAVVAGNMLALVGTVFLCAAHAAEEIPTLKNVEIHARATYDSKSKHYTYHYRVANPATNTGHIWNFDINLRTDPRAPKTRFPLEGLEIPYRKGRIRSFERIFLYDSPFEPGVAVVPIGQQVPPGWDGGFERRDGYVSFSAASADSRILPGQSVSGFVLVSPGLPTLREAEAVPKLLRVVADRDDVTDEELRAAGRSELNQPWESFSLGPSSLDEFGSFKHWTQLAADLERATALGWIPSAPFAQTLRHQLGLARAALDEGDGALAKIYLQTLLQTLQRSQASECSPAVFDLLTLNIASLLEVTPDRVDPTEPLYSIVPRRSTQPIGTQCEITVKIVDAAKYEAPMAGQAVRVEISSGPNAAKPPWSGFTDEKGEFRFAHTSTAVGTDSLQLFLVSTDLAAEAEVVWAPGPDLIVSHFSPPYVRSKGGNPVYISEITQNIGPHASNPSTTRYYFSMKSPFDPASARVIGERRVSSLASGDDEGRGMTRFTLPSDLAFGVFYFAACADADHEIVETDETNNCFFSYVEDESGSRVIIKRGGGAAPRSGF